MTAIVNSSPRRGPRQGVAITEFVIIMVIFGIGVATLYGLFWRSSEDAFNSKWAYFSAHVAREELEATRTMNLFAKRGTEAYNGHDWEPVAGSMLRRIATDPLEGEDAVTYPEHYSRMETRVEIDGEPDGRARVVRLSVRYQEKGAGMYGFTDKDGNPKPIGQYQMLVVNRWIR